MTSSTTWGLVGFASVLLVSAGCSSSNDVTNPPQARFVDNANGTVTDTATHLIWLKNGTCLGLKNFADATTAAAALGQGTTDGNACGLTDGSQAGQWRLPSEDGRSSPYTGAKELESILAAHYPDCTSNPCIDPIFEATASNGYWSSSTYSDNPDAAWGVNFTEGFVGLVGKSSGIQVRAVRGGP
jgi:hypothetical protein